MPGYTVKHQCDPKRCVDCDHFYYDNKLGACRCSAGHVDSVGRYAVACEDFKKDSYYDERKET